MIETTANGHNSAKAMLPPHNLEAEKSVLGAVLLDERHLNGLVFDEQLRADHFFREQYGRVFEAMLKLHQNDRKIDHLTVADVLRERGQLEAIGGPEAIDELAGWVPAAGHAREYGRIVRENAHMRALLRATYEIQAQVAERRHRGEEMIEEAERLIFALRGKELQAKHRLLEHAVAEEIDRVERAAQRRPRDPRALDWDPRARSTPRGTAGRQAVRGRRAPRDGQEPALPADRAPRCAQGAPACAVRVA